MRMKKKIRMCVIKLVVLFILAGFISYCGGGGYRQQPQTEPEESGEKAETEPQERLQKGEESKKEETAEPEPPKKEDESIVVTPVERPPVAPEEKLPVIEPQEPPRKVEPLEETEIQKYMKTLNLGIANIFKEFGYAGDIQVPVNFKKRVAYYTHYFSENRKGARFFRRAMHRGSQYLPMIREALKKKHLPLSLAYLPVVESGFNPDARSRAKAVGMWQFMRGTARMYGLTVTRWKDERKDPVKATYAAAEYLNDLLAMFGQEDPFLGICAYNAGEGKILNALRQISYRDRSFWTLVKKNLLRYETNEYIPRFIAVILINRDPAKYVLASKDISVEPDEEEDLEIISSLHSTKDDLGAEKTTPEPEPEPEKIELKKAEIKKARPAEAAPSIPQKPGDTPAVYKVKRGDTLYSIARLHRVGVRTLKKWNGLRSNRIYPGQKLKIYASSAGVKLTKPAAVKRHKLIYTVNYTDSLARIALFFKGISARDIMRWNQLRRTRIYPKQKLVLYLKEPPRKVLTHIIRHGETARAIARRYKVRVEYVLSLNGLVTNSRLKPGKRLKIYYF